LSAVQAPEAAWHAVVNSFHVCLPCKVCRSWLLAVCDEYCRLRLLIADARCQLSLLHASFSIVLTVSANQKAASLFYPPTSRCYRSITYCSIAGPTHLLCTSANTEKCITVAVIISHRSDVNCCKYMQLAFIRPTGVCNFVLNDIKTYSTELRVFAYGIRHFVLNVYEEM